MKDQINAYLNDHATSWSKSTLKSETSRLNAISEHMASPEDLYKYLQGINQKPYTIKITFVRMVDFEKWSKSGNNQFKDFMEKYGNKFKHAYQKEEINITYAEASARIKMLDEPYKTLAIGLLTTGLRISEAFAVQDGKVQGKGGKVRKVYGIIKETAPKATFTRKLKAVGLKPHTLRKLCATRLAELGASPADLCKVFGWSSITTAYQYLQAREDSKLEALMAACQEKP